jgi:hypothetical protein
MKFHPELPIDCSPTRFDYQQKGMPVDPKLRALIAFGGATFGAVVLQNVASRQAAKLGIPHAAVGLVAAVIAHES